MSALSHSLLIPETGTIDAIVLYNDDEVPYRDAFYDDDEYPIMRHRHFFFFAFIQRKTKRCCHSTFPVDGAENAFRAEPT